MRAIFRGHDPLLRGTSAPGALRHPLQTDNRTRPAMWQTPRNVPGLLPAMSTSPPATDTSRLRLIVESYARLTRRELPLAPADDLATALWLAPAAIVAHGTEPDPVFFYGNRLALELFEMDFAVFTRLPSRFSAEPLRREERALLLARVARDGFIDDYSGIRIAASGRRFRIERATVWNLVDAAGLTHGQAATFAHWTPLE